MTVTNQQRPLDFVSDTAKKGRVLRVVTVVDSRTRECLTIEVDVSL